MISVPLKNCSGRITRSTGERGVHLSGFLPLIKYIMRQRKFNVMLLVMWKDKIHFVLNLILSDF